MSIAFGHDVDNLSIGGNGIFNLFGVPFGWVPLKFHMGRYQYLVLL